MNREQRRLARLDRVRRRGRQHRVGSPHQERVAVVAEVVVDWHAGAAQLVEDGLRHRGDVPFALRREDFRHVEVDGRIVPGLRPEERRRAQAALARRVEDRRHAHDLGARLVRHVKALAGDAIHHAVVDHAVAERSDAGDQRRVRWMRHAREHGLGALGFHSGPGQAPHRRQIDRRVLQVEVREAVDRDEDHVAAGLGLGGETDRSQERGDEQAADASSSDEHRSAASRPRRRDPVYRGQVSVLRAPAALVLPLPPLGCLLQRRLGHRRRRAAARPADRRHSVGRARPSTLLTTCRASWPPTGFLMAILSSPAGSAANVCSSSLIADGCARFSASAGTSGFPPRASTSRVS